MKDQEIAATRQEQIHKLAVIKSERGASFEQIVEFLQAQERIATLICKTDTDRQEMYDASVASFIEKFEK